MEGLKAPPPVLYIQNRFHENAKMSKRDSVGNVLAYRTASRVGGRIRMPMRRYARRLPRNKGLKTLVNRAIARAEEKKESSLFSINTPLPSSGNGPAWTASSISIAPSSTGFVIPQGTGQGNRIGNRITTKRATVKGILHQNGYNAANNVQPVPVQMRMLIFKDKFNKSG